MNYFSSKMNQSGHDFSGSDQNLRDKCSLLINTDRTLRNNHCSPNIIVTSEDSKKKYDSLSSEPAVNPWLPLPHPCVFATNWSSLQLDLLKRYPLFCPNSNSTPTLNQSNGMLDSEICESSSTAKEVSSDYDYYIEGNVASETDSNNVLHKCLSNEHINEEADQSVTENVFKGCKTSMLANKEMNSFLTKKFTARETTNFLKSWLNDHRHNPYPTKNEKVMLALITKMSLTQISTWFANARRRLKKENQMTWTPKIRHHRISTHSLSSNNNINSNQSCHRHGNHNYDSDKVNNKVCNYKSTMPSAFPVNQRRSTNPCELNNDNTRLLSSQLVLNYFLRKDEHYSQFRDKLKGFSNVFSTNSDFPDIASVMSVISIGVGDNNENTHNKMMTLVITKL
ncbi:unnamed protein product [Heterobilharzia americana]|nr:unnamed protein product [Heterobilharzia americana]